MSQAVTILGSTGSIGVNTLDVIARHRERFHVLALTAHSNVQLLAEQCAQHHARYAIISDISRAADLRLALSQAGSAAKVLAGAEGLLAAATLAEADIVMAAIVGAAGLKPTLAAAKAGKKILLANKESLVIAGGLFMQAAKDAGACVLPVDSEHNAIFQSLPLGWQSGLEDCGVERIILTASGGPFLNTPLADMAQITPTQACKHPNWEMGRKISVDSATLMNKGLELIEAHWLFSAQPDQLDVVVHPQSIIHSMVAYRDGSVLAQLGTPDMRTPIAYALAWPERIEAGVQRLNLAQMSDLTFREPDLDRFPCLGLAYAAMSDSASAPITLNAANEVAVQCFLDSQIRFDQIAALVGQVLERAERSAVNSLEDVFELDRDARAQAKEVIGQWT
ncbi:MAG: 1-deoxy-D-xylulose-5-phosphate reductoisomerase [Xanthomonadales bacterium]|nr:1-deoxy-D-xylulose-5-phosphate reductoisomerase [Xanthomonadales bacterium]